MLTEIMIEENSYHDWGMLISEHLWLNAPVNNLFLKVRVMRIYKDYLSLPNVFCGDCYIICEK